MGTPFFTPRSSTFDTSSIPFVFNDGVLSLYSPRIDETISDSEPCVTPPFSSFSDASFLEVLPNRPRSGKSAAHPILQKFAIWHRNEEEDDHVYAEASCVTGPGIHETISLEDLDPSLFRYGAVRAHLAQISGISCPFMHLSLPLTPFAPNVAEDPHPIESAITISTPSRSPVRLICTIYNRGTIVYANQTTMKTEGPLHLGDAQHSTGLPHQFVDELCRDLDGRYSKEDGMLHSTAVLLFVQHPDPAESNEEEQVILVLVCNFEAGQGSEHSQARFSYLSLETFLSEDLSTHVDFPPSPPLSGQDLPNVKQLAFESTQSSKRSKRRIPRVFPKLSVAIPPPCHGKGRIQLYTDSPAPTTTLDIHLPPTPQSGVPENVCPVTQFPTALHPPDIWSSKVCSRAGDASILTESAYPFILTTTTSSSSLHSPGFDLLDSSRRGESEPYSHRSQTRTPVMSSPPPSSLSPWFQC